MNKKIFRIIVAEDERLIARNIKTMVQQCGDEYQVTHIARDGNMALDLISKYLPDIVITDIKMPEMNGMELVSELNYKFPQITKIVVSGYAEFEYAQTAIQENVKNYLLKPIDITELKKTLDGIKQDFLLENNKLFEQDIDSEQIAHNIRDYLLENYSKEIQITDIAEKLRYSPSYITKVFKDEYQVSPIQFLRKHRMEVAQQLLSSTDCSIVQIAKMVGIPDPFYFSRAFKSIYGIAPSEIRK